MPQRIAARPLSRLVIALSILLIGLVASDMFASGIADAVNLALCLGALVGTAGVAMVQRRRSADRLSGTSDPFVGGTIQLGLYLSPVILLTVVFPLATHRIAHVTVDGTPLVSVLLAASLTVPWLSQTVCLPLYRAVGDLMPTGTRTELESRLCQAWPSTFAKSLLALVVFAVPVELVARWSMETIGAYVLLGVLYIAFSQSLIIGIVGKRRVLWAVGWTLFAAALLAAPSWWFLPPLVGLLTQLVPLRRHLLSGLRPVAMEWRDVAADLGRGFLLGSVLWCDKLFYFLRVGPHMPVVDVFVALLPAILAYNYYFVRLAPGFDAHVNRMRTAMEQDAYRNLASSSRQLAGVVEESIARTALSGAVLGVIVTFIVGIVQPHALALVATISAASWLFMMTTVLCYKLDYIGDRVRAQLISAVHLAACIVAFALLPPGTATYATLIVVEAGLFTLSLRSCLAAWRTSEYRLFWSHATGW